MRGPRQKWTRTETGGEGNQEIEAWREGREGRGR